MGRFNQGGGFGGGGRSFGGGSRGGSGRGGPSQMHPAVCSDCGSDCEVPFRPTGDRPVLCSACFHKGGKSASDSGSYDRPRRDFSAPRSFQPSAPRASFSAPANNDWMKDQLGFINKKLDAIVKALNINTQKDATPAVNENPLVLTTVKAEKEVKEKKTTKKTATKEKAVEKKKVAKKKKA